VDLHPHHLLQEKLGENFVSVNVERGLKPEIVVLVLSGLMHYFTYKENIIMCLHKFSASESEDLTPLVDITIVEHYLRRFSIFVKFSFEVRFPFVQYTINVF